MQWIFHCSSKQTKVMRGTLGELLVAERFTHLRARLLAMVQTMGQTGPGSEERKSYDLARMKSATVYFGLPLIFLTFNPTETSSPVSLFYSGEEIDVSLSSTAIFFGTTIDRDA
jgi:hypothetical protein